MSSIIDEIHGAELLVEGIKSRGRKEIQSIYDGAAKKEADMQAHFAEEFRKESAQMEEDMLQKVAAHETQLKESFQDQAQILGAVLEQCKAKAAEALIGEFWEAK